MIADEYGILEYLPQRPPMVMVGKLMLSEDKRTVTTLRITGDNLFTEQGVFTEPGLIENMAQTAAAGEGFRARSRGLEPSRGFIGGIRDLKIYRLPKTGEEITTESLVTCEVMNATVVSARVFSGPETLAACELKIFLLNQTTP